MLLTLAEVQASNAINIAGVPSSSAAFISLLNEATRRLLRRGDWEGTVVPMHLPVQRDVVIFPAFVGPGGIRKILISQEHVPIRGMFYDFLDFQHRRYDLPTGWTATRASFMYMGQVPAMVEIPGTYTEATHTWTPGSAKIKAYIADAADAGKTLTYFGYDGSSELIRNDTTNPWSEGETLTLVDPSVEGAKFVSRLDRIVKQSTKGTVTLKMVISAVETTIATLGPLENNPAYSKYRLKWTSGVSSSQPASLSAVAIVKCRYVPVASANDVVLIENVDALKEMMQSVKFAEAGDTDSADKYEARAIRELNLDLDNAQPIDQMPVSVEPFNGMGFGSQRMW